MGEGKRIDVLDHGYVQLVDAMGTDEDIIRAARMSTGGGFKGWGPVDGKPGDEKLLRFLWEHDHATPFEFGSMVVEVQAPIFVFREWMRHRTFSYNEASARYAPLPDLNYVPTVERLMMSGGVNKQAQGSGGALTLDQAGKFIDALHEAYARDEKTYRAALDRGVPKELARLVLPVGRYSRMRASANLRNWLAFLRLRLATNAQWEIRCYARAVGALVAERWPRTWALFEDSVGAHQGLAPEEMRA
jgi:thymidylate synthase (FAD)